MKSRTSLLAVAAACSLSAVHSFAGTMIDAGPIQQWVNRHPDNITIDFTLLDKAAFAVKIDFITDPPQLLFLDSPDPQDIARNPVKTGGTCGVGTVLQAAGSKDGFGNATDSCTEQFSVNLFDPRDPLDPNNDFGKWYLRSDVRAHQNTDPSNTDADVFGAIIFVLDAKSTNPIPEPASMLLIGGGLIGLGLFRWRIPRVKPPAEE